ncbi:aminodeoxychorismate synthase component I [Sphingopyxis sp. 22461]|uniref:aminodeoxychorismate synthase component I n=1 Tax=Sphingopyxis sp. 22461 TaxID=3453923 RepID=UPI003F870277
MNATPPPGNDRPFREAISARPRGWFGEPEGADNAESGTPGAMRGRLADILSHASATESPFALLDDQLRGRATLFTRPVRVFTTHDASRFPAILDDMRAALASGSILAGFLSYRAGSLFDAVATGQVLLPSGVTACPLLWFAEFERQQDVFTDPADLSLRPTRFEPAIARTNYEAMVGAALEHIRRGDAYQVNLTFPATVAIGDPIAFYCAVRERSRAPYGAYIDMGARQIHSFSPELFFRMEGRLIETRPMKGTRRRGSGSAADYDNARALFASAKERAENLMIVDLMRNDISKICVPGSVRVPHLFALEPYPSVWQMTSTVSGRLKETSDAFDVLQALFPCGSITGAPKIMATHLIAALEQFDRGLYTGAIGIMGGENATFNVAIRTIDQVGTQGRVDVGAGIVADSRPHDEWLECLAKAAFLP